MPIAARCVLLALLLLPPLSLAPARAATGVPAFDRTWDRTDKPVGELGIDRTWMWGLPVTGVTLEPYAGSPGGMRQVAYFDKSRMEINDPNAVDDGLWYVTNGLLVVEMVEGHVQLGDTAFDERPDPAAVNIAGDPAGEEGIGPTYADIGRYGLRQQPASMPGSLIIQRLDGAGNRSDDPSMAAHGVTAVERLTVPGIDHTVASVFWAFMNGSGPVWEEGRLVEDRLFIDPYYATGYPITEAWWSRVVVAGTERDVLWQCFERRCLTWTPGNRPGWDVEAGNVGQHYYRWRHGGTPPLDPTVIYQSHMTDWPLLTTVGGDAAYPTGEDYRITAYRGGTLVSLHPQPIGDGSLRVQVRRVSTTGSASACLVARAQPHPSARTAAAAGVGLCLDWTGSSATVAHAFRVALNGDGLPVLQETGSWALPAPISAGAWTELRIDATGGSRAYYVNGAAIGASGSGGLASGQIGVAVVAGGGATITAAFRDITLHRL